MLTVSQKRSSFLAGGYEGFCEMLNGDREP